MEDKEWPFNDPPNVMVLTTKDIINKIKSIQYVSHDEDDGMWQFHDGSEVDTQSAMIVSLAEIFDIDSSLKEISDLPLGWVAWRKERNGDWKKEPAND
jgi:hypothetical protein